ncbi:DUF935 domain-containing protein [Pseudoruegeria sp. HB172150]|uniref:DUF935 domain-containing protein n=1 Tax=Pseudoruegeria sp. HB172150 TaxID=2721164 RepID=UPI0015537D19|nr:DUF935 domain-containing protein [Pseudoruegeria sp. HB172150]
MAGKPTLYDRWGNPLRRAELTREVAAPTIGGVRSPISGRPADGLDPVRLASILRSADKGDPVRYLELAEVLEERDLHYLGVLATRKRSVSQIDITVVPGGDDKRSAEIATAVEDWLDRDELAFELFDILDAIGKGYSFTEIVWDTSMGQWQPQELVRRDQRWFRFDRADLTTPVLLDETGQEQPLPAFKFIDARIAAKSGLPLRSGLARVAAWAWMFKAYTQRDWAIFTQTYGQPLRVGKYGPGASETDRDTLFTAVANIAGDCAAIIPESMSIDFVEAANVASSSDLYEKRADWLDKQMSKAVLGQTATTDAETGGLGSGKEHREVQEDIERADAKALSAILNRDLVRPWVQLEWGPQPAYPRIVIARPEQEDLQLLADSVDKLVARGLKVGQDEIRGKFGLSKPGPDEEILSVGPSGGAEGDGTDRNSSIKHFSGVFKRVRGVPRPETLLSTQRRSTAVFEGSFDPAEQADLITSIATPVVAAMIAHLEEMMEAAGSMEELREMWLSSYPDLDDSALVETLAEAFAAATLGGIAEVAEEDG